MPRTLKSRSEAATAPDTQQPQEPAHCNVGMCHMPTDDAQTHRKWQGNSRKVRAPRGHGMRGCHQRQRQQRVLIVAYWLRTVCQRDGVVSRHWLAATNLLGNA